VNAMPTVVAAVVVIAAGAATGLAVGGKTKTRTVTVAGAERTVTVTVPGEVDNPVVSPAAPETETTPEGVETTQGPTGFDPVALSEELVTIDDTTHSTKGDDAQVDLSSVEYGALAQLQQGSEKNDSMTFDFDYACCGAAYAADYYQFEITVPEHATRFETEMGFLKGEATGNTVNVSFYINEYEEGKAVRQRGLSSATETAPVSLDVTGESKVIVRMTCANRDRIWRVPSGDIPSFGFLDAHFE
jgi:hypothetical protein